MSCKETDPTEIDAVAFLNNSISCALFKADMERRRIPLERAAVILGRPIRPNWIDQCAIAVQYSGNPRNDLLGQWRFISFYQEAAATLRRILKAGNARELYIVNNDNLITSHMLAAARDDSAKTVTVVAEGLMNFQDIGPGNRAGWRWRTKPLLAAVLGLEYTAPETHLSGAFEPQADRVVSFAREGLKAPTDKVVLIAFPKAVGTGAANPRVALIPLTGLAQWMTPDAAEEFARGFRTWLLGQGFEKILVKPHPHSDAGQIGRLLPPHEVMEDRRNLEDMAGELETGTIIGTCCTALATLKLIRPELHCIDYGADYYQLNAYAGDRSVETLLRGVGVEMVPFAQAQHTSVAS